MTAREVTNFKRAIKAKTSIVSKSKAKARAFLVSTGIISSNGNITKSYANICTQPKQD